MPLTVNAKNIMLNAIAAQATTASLHVENPGETGANEVTGGTPAYARKAITWGTASGANLDSSNTPTFDVPAGTTVRYFGLWNGSTFLGSGPAGPETFTAQGTCVLADADVNLPN